MDVLTVSLVNSALLLITGIIGFFIRTELHDIKIRIIRLENLMLTRGLRSTDLFMQNQELP